ncbi:MAG TPA: T9SS type A sorting domain-containing protein [Saprospiraceae bacterium]|nr:T9SS type A sorting domain-containing protein [Saprospiraceae bacterium]
MKNHLTILYIFLGSGCLMGQVNIAWQRCIGGSMQDEGTTVCKARNGDFVVAGYALSEDGDVAMPNGFNDYFITRLDSLGEIKWTQSFGGTGHDRAYTVHECEMGYLISGNTKSNDGDVSGYHGDFDGWAVKVDNNGVLQWQKCYGGMGWESFWASKQTLDKGHILVGRSGEIDGDVTGNQGFIDVWAVRIDSLGEIEWQTSIGGSALDIAYAVDVCTDGGYIIAGESQSNDKDVSANFGSSDYWIVKLSAEGKIVWERTYGGSLLDRPNDIKQTIDGGYVVIGQSNSSDGDITNAHGGFDFWILKLDALGNIVWQQSLGGTNNDFGRSVTLLNNGSFVFSGGSLSKDGDLNNNLGNFDCWVVCLSADGILKWQKNIGGEGDDWANAITSVNNESLVIAGYTWSNDNDVSGNHGSSDYWIVKLSAPSSSTSAPEPARLMLAPNPAREHIQLLWPPVESGARVRITDALGRVHIDTRLDATGVLDVSGLQSGVYFVEAMGAVEKLVKE